MLPVRRPCSRPQLGSFGLVYDWVFPIWSSLLLLAFVLFEIRKQAQRVSACKNTSDVSRELVESWSYLSIVLVDDGQAYHECDRGECDRGESVTVVSATCLLHASLVCRCWS